MIGLSSSLKAAAVVVTIASIVGSVWYVSSLRSNLALSERAVKGLEDRVQEQVQVISDIQKEQEQIRAISSNLAGQIRSREKDIKDLRTRFEKTSTGGVRDLGKEAIADPAAVERAINRGTANAARCMEIASGSPLTEAERNATKPEQINKECPSLANPSFKPGNSR